VSRHEFSKETQRQAYRRCNGFCEGKECGIALSRSNFHYDHIDPDWFSGSNALDNCQVLCLRCHKEKTAKDVANIAKVKRIQDKNRNIRKPVRSWGYGKKDKFKKKVTGEVVPR